MKTKEIALIIIFVALTIALDPVRIPSGYLLGVSYRFSEIPILAAFLLFGPKIGVSIAAFNVPAEIMLFPLPGMILGVPFVFVLTLCMLAGIHFASKHLKSKGTPLDDRKKGLYYTAFGTLSRTIVAPFLVAINYKFVLPIVGFQLLDIQILALMPALALYALTFSLYSIPIGYIIARTIDKNLKISNILQLQKRSSAAESPSATFILIKHKRLNL
jgi:riboflavin transporter FmnP